jgi:hypothetical protein
LKNSPDSKEVAGMEKRSHGCTLTRRRVVDLYFLEHRAKLIDIAAFLDRVDRAPSDQEVEDFRIAKFKQALVWLGQDGPLRARRVLEAFSDPTDEPIASAAGLKGAFGAWPGFGQAESEDSR